MGITGLRDWPGHRRLNGASGRDVGWGGWGHGEQVLQVRRDGRALGLCGRGQSRRAHVETYLIRQSIFRVSPNGVPTPGLYHMMYPPSMFSKENRPRARLLNAGVRQAEPPRQIRSEGGRPHGSSTAIPSTKEDSAIWTFQVYRSGGFLKGAVARTREVAGGDSRHRDRSAVGIVRHLAQHCDILMECIRSPSDQPAFSSPFCRCRTGPQGRQPSEPLRVRLLFRRCGLDPRFSPARLPGAV